MAGLDGIANKIDPGPPMDRDLYELPPEEAKEIKQLPGSLDVVLDALEQDHAFLRKGEVFSKDLIESWIAYKRTEVDAIRLRPHPWEFALYFDA
jgi:glutamine synthetase